MRAARLGLPTAALGLAVSLLAGSVDGAALPARRADAVQWMQELMSGRARVGGPFTLIDSTGRPRSLAEFRGHVVLLYFGYMACPDVCPTDLLEIGRLAQRLDRRGEPVQPLFVTLDPERDRADGLQRYAAAFHPRMIALRGTPAQVREVAAAYKVFFEKVPQPGAGSYTIDHTAFVYLLDHEGRYVAFFPPGTSAERMDVVVRQFLKPPNRGTPYTAQSRALVPEQPAVRALPT